MQRILAIVLVGLAACASQSDARPATVDYIIEAILVPYCGRGGCHSSTTAAHDLVFDTIDNAVASMSSQRRGETLVVPGSPQQSLLVQVLSDGSRIMPPDMPLPDADIALITQWITDGAAGLP